MTCGAVCPAPKTTSCGSISLKVRSCERSAFEAYLDRKAASTEAFCFSIVSNHAKVALGIASLMRIDRPNRVIEVGGIHYSRALQRTACRDRSHVSACALRL